MTDQILNGGDWFTAPLPHRWHHCTPTTSVIVAQFGNERVDRCACGAIRMRSAREGDTGWMNKNSRRPR